MYLRMCVYLLTMFNANQNVLSIHVNIEGE